MYQPREWRPKSHESKFIETQAQVYVTELDREMNGVKSASQFEFRSLHRHARSGNRGYLMNAMIAAEPAGLLGTSGRVEMPRAISNPNDDARMLDSPVGIE